MNRDEFKRIFWGPRLSPAECNRLTAQGKFLVECCGWLNPNAEGFLRGELAGQGQVDSSFIFRMGGLWGFNRRTLQRVAERLNIQKTFVGNRTNRKVLWCLIDDKLSSVDCWKAGKVGL
jgi:hypothetical protein